MSVVLLFACVYTVAGPDASFIEEIQHIVSRPPKDSGVHGAVLIAVDDRIAYRAAFGMSNRETLAENSPDTKFLIGSLTKSFVAALVLQLVEENKLSLTAKIQDYLSWYRMDTGSQVSIHHLLSHTSGIPNYLADLRYFTTGSQSPYARRSFVETYCSGDLEFKPGTQFAYSPSGYVILGEIIETATGVPLAEAFHNRIAKPLGLTATDFADSLDEVDSLATGYVHSTRGYRRARKFEVSTAGGSGAMYSTVDDLLSWRNALLDGAILTEKSRNQMFTPNLEDYGYGWYITNRAIAGEEVVIQSHGGRINGFNSAIICVPKLRLSVVLLNNVEQFSAMETAMEIMDVVIEIED